MEASNIERGDMRYWSLHELRTRYLSDVVAIPDLDQLGRQHTARPDEVFRALCALLIVAAFEMEPGRDGGGRAIWESDEWIMHANRVGAVPSWRSGTDHPDDFRPDFVLTRRHMLSRSILLDAKASVDRSGHVPGERLKEIQAYLNAFGFRRAGVLYPGPMERAKVVLAEDIAGHGYLVRELPVRPVDPEDLEVMLENLRRNSSN